MYLPSAEQCGRAVARSSVWLHLPKDAKRTPAASRADLTFSHTVGRLHLSGQEPSYLGSWRLEAAQISTVIEGGEGVSLDLI